MEIKLIDNQGNTRSIYMLKSRIQTEIDKGNSVLVNFLQPGVQYLKNGKYCTVVDFMNEYHDKPVRFQSNLVPLKECKSNFSYTNDMFMSGPKLYQENKMCKKLLQKLLKHDEKQVNKHWDMLLGEASDNKDWLFEQIKNHLVHDKTLLTYFGRDTNKGAWSVDVVRPKTHTAETLNKDTQIRCSDLIDPEIYNSTYYTAMIETTIHNDFAMFSEKQAKPIIAKRPFIIFGSCGHLKAFRSLGFKSFSEVIDESYDNIVDKSQRWQKALDSMLLLSRQDPLQVYKKLTQVLEHNKKHFEDNEWKRCITWNSYL